jgi:tRNA G18 (ribose-2'-O)-methylase SpoU
VVSVPGAGRIESLNVAVAAGILMAEMKRASWGIR